MTDSLTLFDRIWNTHVVARRDGAALLWVDRHLLHEGSARAFERLEQVGSHLRRRDLTFGTADRYVPGRSPGIVAIPPHAAGLIAALRDNARRHAFDAMHPGDPRRGIVHVICAEQGLVLPGLTLACADSHTATQGAFGCLALSLDTTETTHVLATQTVWRTRPLVMRITLKGSPRPYVAAKDLILAVIARIGTAGAAGHAIEFAGPAVAELSMEARMTLCNMAIEAGAWTALIAPDDTTFAYLRARPRAPRGHAWDLAVSDWRKLATDPGARFDAEVALDASTVQPLVTWGTTPQTALPVTSRVPDPAGTQDAATANAIARQLAAMRLLAGQPLEGLPIDYVFIGSCTNGRIEDLRQAAAILLDRRAVVPGLVVPGSVPVQRQAEREGLDRIFSAAGLLWGEPGCSSCIGLNGDVVPAHARCAATISRNYVGRQGPGACTHLMSPAMAAAAAVTGAITDVRRLVG